MKRYKNCDILWKDRATKKKEDKIGDAEKMFVLGMCD